MTTYQVKVLCALVRIVLAMLRHGTANAQVNYEDTKLLQDYLKLNNE